MVEIILVIFMITMFSGILVYNFPRALKQFALSRVSYKLAQDLRKVEDLGLSGFDTIQGAKGYGIYVSTNIGTEYILYADRGDVPDSRFDGSSQLCAGEFLNPQEDCILETVDISKENPGLYIDNLENILGFFTSINFSPPNPDIAIDNLSGNEVGIVLKVHDEIDLERRVWVNTSGLIKVE